MSDEIVTHYRSCHLCEAICGVEIRTQGDQLVSVRGDKADPFSQGYICPKATALQDIHEDPDRVKYPLKREGERWLEISWQEAYDEIADQLTEIQKVSGNDSVAFFAGNPCVHNYGTLTHAGQLRKAVDTKSHFSASSTDQLPHHLVSLAMYGHQHLLPIPDIDNTDYMLIIGGNPLASNGSLMTAPNVKKRLKMIKERGGKFIVIDPRRTETAEIASEHHFIRPGSDAFLLLAMIHTLFDEELVNTGDLSDILDGLDEIAALAQGFTPERAAEITGIAAPTIRQLAREIATTERAVCYGRMGVSTQAFGSLCIWAIHMLNILSNHLGKRGGFMVTTAAFANITNSESEAGYYSNQRTRVNALPIFSGESPATVLADEILTPGEGQIRAMITIAGNPALSSPNSAKINKALSSLDFMVSIDFYINETTRHANIILPPSGPLEHDNYDITFNRLAVRNVARYNEPVFERSESMRHDWEIMNELAKTICARKNIPIVDMPAPMELLDVGLKNGPWGATSGAREALDLATLKAHPHGIDLGPLQVGFRERLNGTHSTIKLNVEHLLSDVKRLEETRFELADDELLLIGRRHVRSNNSWLHNSRRLVKGPPRWHLLMHPEDMEKFQLSDKGLVRIESRVGEVRTTVSASDDVMPGVISLPHGWGHNTKGVKLTIASTQEGANCNDLTDDSFYDVVSGNAALNGVVVRVSAI